ncbi:MAG: hypothetical protein IAE97_03345 [Chthoniobacterales bacterium]|nr:hypothetical protein [Chthoniobacterales bacterium]
MGLETSLQWFVHSFEQGRAAIWLRRFLFVFIFLAAGAVWLLLKFNGFNDPDAMDQAQIGRQLASGQGYTTLYARPLALNRMLLRTGHVPAPLPDVSQAPLGPLLNAVAFRITGVNFGVPQRGFISSPEKIIALTGFLFFAGSVALTYLLARRLFDPKLALLGTGLVMVSFAMWRFSFSGLPQMAMLFFFTGSMLSTVAAMEARAAGRRRRAVLLVALAAFLLGLVALGHGIGLCIFAGFWIFATAAIRPRLLVAPIVAAAGILPVLPWALLNWRALRNPFGLPFYELCRPPGIGRLEFLADFEPLLRFRWTNLIQNTATHAMNQAADFFSCMGGNVVAVAFFLAVILHGYRHWLPAQFRWCILLMWLGAASGMSVFGVEGTFSAGQLHVLFLPVMVIYGLGFLLALWDRLGLDQPMLRGTFLAMLYLIVGAPLLLGFIANPKRMNWPPYLPPLVHHFADWLSPGEALASDIPWATAWYAGRTSLLLPQNIGQFELIHREQLLGGPLVAIYLTPFSGDQRAYADIVNGRYREWARFVLHEVKPADLRGWVLTTAVALPLDGEAMFYADRPRWQ